MSGYSQQPLTKKLGIRENFRVRTENAPDHFIDLLSPVPANAVISNRLRHPVDIWHIFTRTKKGLGAKLERAMQAIPGNGVIWVSWPRKSSAEATDMTEDEVRKAALPLGLVDVKVCAIDETWSGLKLVLRREYRK